MKMVYAGIVAAIAALAYQQDFFAQDAGIDPVTVSSIKNGLVGGEKFFLVAGGVKSDCVITAVGEGPKKDLTVTPDCSQQLPALAKVKWWIDRDDGSVAFVSSSGDVAAEFAAGDGAALESFAPRKPLLALFAM